MNLAQFILLGASVWALIYMGWFWGRCHEANREAMEEQKLEDAYEWASRHGKL